jgi:hypothetical protein
LTIMPASYSSRRSYSSDTVYSGFTVSVRSPPVSGAVISSPTANS